MIDLHAHLEGSLSHQVISRLARRHGLPVPPLGFSGFRGFLKAFGSVCDLLRDPEDFSLAATDLFHRAWRSGVIHMEVLFSPQVYLRRGVSLQTMMTGLIPALDRTTRRGRFSAVYIADGVRQWGGEWFETVVGLLAPYADRGLAGVGIGGDETAVLARDFARSYRLARKASLHTTVHAGEVGGVESLKEALQWLRPERIGHGIAALEDRQLTRRLARNRTVLEVCPTSNLRTGVARSWKSHPFPSLLEAGVRVTLNSDDGTFFGTSVNRELARAEREWGLNDAQIRRVLLNAVEGAFVRESVRRDLRRRVIKRYGAS